MFEIFQIVKWNCLKTGPLDLSTKSELTPIGSVHHPWSSAGHEAALLNKPTWVLTGIAPVTWSYVALGQLFILSGPQFPPLQVEM